MINRVWHVSVILMWCNDCNRAWVIFMRRASFTKISRARMCFWRVVIRRLKLSSQTLDCSTLPNCASVAG